MAEHCINGTAIQVYMQYLQQEERSASTIEKYSRDLHRFAAWLETRKNKAVSKAVVVIYKSELSARYSPASVNCMLAALNGFFLIWGGMNAVLNLCVSRGCCMWIPDGN